LGNLAFILFSLVNVHFYISLRLGISLKRVALGCAVILLLEKAELEFGAVSSNSACLIAFEWVGILINSLMVGFWLSSRKNSPLV
jgi:hypothetical protein